MLVLRFIDNPVKCDSLYADAWGSAFTEKRIIAKMGNSKG